MTARRAGSGSHSDAVFQQFRAADKEATGLMEADRMHALLLQLGWSTEDFHLALGQVQYEPCLQRLFASSAVRARMAATARPKAQANAGQGARTLLAGALENPTTDKLVSAIAKAEAETRDLGELMEHGRKRLQELQLQKKEEQERPPRQLRKVWKFWFIRRATFLELPEKAWGVPRHQELRDRGLLEEHEVHMRDALMGRLASDMAVISHRWFQNDHPDPLNVKLRRTKELLKQQPDWKLLWMDWLCLPQNEGGRKRTIQEDVYFAETLYNVNVLYLGLHVVILYDNQYSGRFWPCLECWSAFQVPTSEGVREYATQQADCRATFCCVGGAEGTERQVQELMRRQWGSTSARDAAVRLASDSVSVADQRDKDIQLEVLRKLDEQVAELVNELIIAPLRLDDWHAWKQAIPGIGGKSVYQKLTRKWLKGLALTGSEDSSRRLECLRLKLDGADRYAKVFSAEGQELLKLQHGGTVKSVCALPDGRLFTGSADSYARLFFAEGQELLRLQHGGAVLSVHALADGRLFTGSVDCYARLFSTEGREVLKLQHGGIVRSVHVLPDRRLATGCDDCHARLFSAEGQELHKLAHDAAVLSVHSLPGGCLVTGSGGRYARVFSFKEGEEGEEAQELLKLLHGGAVRSVHALPDGRFATGSDDCHARLFSARGTELLQLHHGGNVTCVHMLPDGRLVTGSADRCARLFSAEGRELLRLQYSGIVTSVHALQDGFLFTGSADKHARLYFMEL